MYMAFDANARGYIIQYLGSIFSQPVQYFTATVANAAVWLMFNRVVRQMHGERSANRFFLLPHQGQLGQHPAV